MTDAGDGHSSRKTCVATELFSTWSAYKYKYETVDNLYSFLIPAY